MRKLLKLVFLVFALSRAGAQNARFSQVGSAPLSLNPALCGRFDGQVRVGGLLSWQSSQKAEVPHQNIYADFKLGKYYDDGDEQTNGPKMLRGFWSLGLGYYHYGSDFTGIMKNNSPVKASFYSLTVARQFYLHYTKDKFVGLGAQIALADGDLNESRGLDYDIEVSGGGFTYKNKFQTGAQKGEKRYVDVSLGGYYGFNTDEISFEIGGSMNHLFYPRNDISNKDAETKLRHRATLHSVVRLKITDGWSLVQKNIYWIEGLYLRSRSFGDSLYIASLWAGAEVYKNNPAKNVSLSGGLYSRNFRTFLPVATVHFGKSLTVRGSYEFPLNLHRYTAYTARRTEIALIYNHKRKSVPAKNIEQKFNFW